MSDYNGILLLNKPAGITSFKSLNEIKKKLKSSAGTIVKTGHTGTLDSFAEGLLVVLTGKFTRLNQSVTGLDKTYEADIVFGTETDTLDPTGQVTASAGIPGIDLIEKEVALFKGKIRQRPPVFSAVHVDGKRAWKLALSGDITELPEREVFIRKFEIISWKSPVLKCRIECSKGTYIRSIARDLGISCGSRASLGALLRTSVGPFRLCDAVGPSEFIPERHLVTGREAVNKLACAEPDNFRTVDTSEACLSDFFNGKPITDSLFKDPPEFNGRYAVFSGTTFAAYIEKDEEGYRYIFAGNRA